MCKGPLTKGMFEYRLENPAPSTRFGLSNGQFYHGYTELIHNGYWYNKHGERLGWGDLSVENFQRISEEIEDNELFIILSEHDGYRRIVRQSQGRETDTLHAPGVKYVAEHAAFIITKNKLYGVEHLWQSKDEFIMRRGLKFIVMQPELVRDFITSYGLSYPVQRAETRTAMRVAFKLAPEIHAYHEKTGVTMLVPSEKETNTEEMLRHIRYSEKIAIGTGSREQPYEYECALDVSPYYAVIDLWLHFNMLARIRKHSNKTFVRVNDWIFSVEQKGVTAEDGHFTKLC